jgi:WD40 repeat protein
MVNILEIIIYIVLLYPVYISIGFLSEMACKRIIEEKEEEKEEIGEISFESRISTVLTGHSHFIFVACYDNIIYVVCAEKKTIIYQLSDVHKDMITCMCLTNDGVHLVSGSKDGKIAIWHINSGYNIRTLSENKNIVTSVAISPDDKLIVSGYANGAIKVWDLSSGECVNTLLKYTHYVNSVMFDETGRQIFCSSDDMTIKKWSFRLETCSESYKVSNSYFLSFVMNRSSPYIDINIGHKTPLKKQVEIIEKLTTTHKEIICFDNNCSIIYDIINKSTSKPTQLLPLSPKFSYSFGVAKNGEIFGYRKSRIIFTGYKYSEGTIIPKHNL